MDEWHRDPRFSMPAGIGVFARRGKICERCAPNGIASWDALAVFTLRDIEGNGHGLFDLANSLRYDQAGPLVSPPSCM